MLTPLVPFSVKPKSNHKWKSLKLILACHILFLLKSNDKYVLLCWKGIFLSAQVFCSISHVSNQLAAVTKQRVFSNKLLLYYFFYYVLYIHSSLHATLNLLFVSWPLSFINQFTWSLKSIHYDANLEYVWSLESTL